MSSENGTMYSVGIKRGVRLKKSSMGFWISIIAQGIKILACSTRTAETVP